MTFFLPLGSKYNILFSSSPSNEMGCIQQRPTRVHAEPNGEKTQSFPNSSNKKVNKQSTQANHEDPSSPHYKPKDPQSNSQKYAKQPTSRSSSKNLEDVISKYAIRGKETAYRTPSIHTYNYKSLIEYNPAPPAQQATERTNLERTTNIFPLSSPGPAHESHSKLLLTRE